MYCKNCGKLIEEGDRFCSGCGEKVEYTAESHAKEGFITEESQEASQPKKKFHIEDFNWDLDGYPTEKRKTEDIHFDWAAVLEEKQRNTYIDNLPEEESEEEKTDSLEELLGSSSQKPERSTSGDGKVDKFFTYNKKNEEFQAMLDKEYERIQNGEEELEPPIAQGSGVSKEAILNRILEDAEGTLTGELASEASEEAQEESLEPDENIEIAEAEDSKVYEPTIEYRKPPKGEVQYIGVALARTPKGVIAYEEAGDASHGDMDLEPEDICFPAEESFATDSGKDSDKDKEAKPEEESGAVKKIAFDDVFGDDFDEEIPKKAPVLLKVVAIILCILVFLEICIIGVQHYAPDSAVGMKINQVYSKIEAYFGGTPKEDSKDNENQASQVNEEIEAQIVLSKDLNENIAQVLSDSSLTFKEGENYGFDDFESTYVFEDQPWYTEEGGHTVTYGEAVVGTVIGYYSSWVDKANGKNDNVLEYIDQTSAFYETIEAIEKEEGVEYGINRLSIGEIRNDNTGFYVLVSITKVSSAEKNDTVEDHIVYLEPERKTMQIEEIKVI